MFVVHSYNQRFSARSGCWLFAGRGQKAQATD